MKKILARIGTLLNRLKGPRNTTILTDGSISQTYTVRLGDTESPVDIYVQSQRIIYRTTYARWWVPDVVQCVYQVCGYAADDVEYRSSIPAAYFETVHYPSLGGALLKWTDYPHLYAIHAFIDRFHFRREERPFVRMPA